MFYYLWVFVFVSLFRGENHWSLKFLTLSDHYIFLNVQRLAKLFITLQTSSYFVNLPCILFPLDPVIDQQHEVHNWEVEGKAMFVFSFPESLLWRTTFLLLCLLQVFRVRLLPVLPSTERHFSWQSASSPVRLDGELFCKSDYWSRPSHASPA